MSSINDLLIQVLGNRRSQLVQQIDALKAADLTALESELAEVEARLKDIDAGIPSITEEKVAAQIQREADAKALLAQKTAAADVAVAAAVDADIAEAVEVKAKG